MPHERRRQRRGKRCPVDEREPLLEARLVRGNASRRERHRRGDRIAVLEHEAFADERLKEMCELGHLACGAMRPLRNRRHPAVVQAVGDERAELRADAGGAAEEAG